MESGFSNYFVYLLSRRCVWSTGKSKIPVTFSRKIPDCSQEY